MYGAMKIVCIMLYAQRFPAKPECWIQPHRPYWIVSQLLLQPSGGLIVVSCSPINVSLLVILLDLIRGNGYWIVVMRCFQYLRGLHVTCVTLHLSLSFRLQIATWPQINQSMILRSFKNITRPGDSALPHVIPPSHFVQWMSSSIFYDNFHSFNLDRLLKFDNFDAN